ncbi:MAG: hypothetical protein U5N26_10605 [Candidatus Marinimicrobia bacterium]|nr:hypothetical protein [Candidatus Neomarinimicrobiota bacterium]
MPVIPDINWVSTPSGLGKFSRTGLLCGIAQWVVVAFYAMNATGTLHWSAAGVLVLILLFSGSTQLTESITASKYPQYIKWRELTHTWLPLPGPFRQPRDREAFLEDLEG